MKQHTTRGQARAIAIPGQRDANLGDVEDALYVLLCEQFDRVGAFVRMKTNEIDRRLSMVTLTLTPTYFDPSY